MGEKTSERGWAGGARPLAVDFRPHHRRQPAVPVGDLAAHDAVELGHQAFGDRPWAALADRDAVHRSGSE